MKTTKKLLVLCLALLMGIFCIMPSTFSWYSHDAEIDNSGNGAQYVKETIPVCGDNGNTKFTTMRKSANGEYNTPLTVSSESTESIDAGKTSYYKTTITNTSDKDTRVGLYLNGIDKKENVFIGTTNPVWNHVSTKNVTTTVLPDYDADSSKIRIYFQPKSWSSEDDKYYIVLCRSEEEADLNVTQELNSLGSVGKPPAETYYYDIPANQENIFFTNTDDPKAVAGNRTSTINVGNDINTHSSADGIVYYYERTDNSGNKNAICNISELANAVNIMHYVNNISMDVGDIKTIALSKANKDYSGVEIEYESNNPSVATVDENGKVEGVEEGTTTVTITVTGVYGDTKTATTKVTVSKMPTPVVQNVKVPAGESVDIYWYVNNGTDSDIDFSDIMLTL